MLRAWRAPGVNAPPEPAVGEAPTGVSPVPGSSSTPWWHAALAFGVVVVALWVIAALSVAYLPWSDHLRVNLFPGRPWLEGWAHWDSEWYRQIAERGYTYVPGDRLTVAFFPAYALAMRAGGAVLGNTLVAGMAVTVASGAAATVMLWTWLRERMSVQAARTALALFLLYPYAFFLFGTVYSDALFIAAVLGAFLLLERDHLWLAGLAGALATATRPIGAVVVVGLALRALERRGALPWGRADGGRPDGRRPAGATDGEMETGGMTTRLRPLVDLSRACRRDAGILLSIAGLAAYSVYLGIRFGHPFLFTEVQKAWGQAPGPHTWLKIEFVKELGQIRQPGVWFDHVPHAVLAVVSLSLVPRVFRRFGWGYGVYSLLAVGLAAFSTKDFFGTGRYVLAAFPCFAAAAEVVVDRPMLRRLVLSGSAAGLIVMTSLFARGAYVS